MRKYLVIAALLGAVALLGGSAAVALGQDALGAGCANQAENDARVRDLFSPLLVRFAPTIGTTVGCLAPSPDGGLSQTTTSGLLYARPEGGGPVRIIVFTDGHRHWAVDANLSRVTLYWEDSDPYPPASGVTRISLSPSEAAAEAPWPPSPPPNVGQEPPTPIPANRPATGEQFSEPSYGGGRGSLTLANQLTIDVAFKMRDADGARATRAFVYVRAGEQAKLEGVRPGLYLIQAVAGADWDRDARIFRRVAQALKVDEPIEFSETETEDGVTWFNGTFTIFPATGSANSGFSPIDLAEFQQD